MSDATISPAAKSGMAPGSGVGSLLGDGAVVEGTGVGAAVAVGEGVGRGVGDSSGGSVHADIKPIVTIVTIVVDHVA